MKKLLQTVRWPSFTHHFHPPDLPLCRLGLLLLLASVIVESACGQAPNLAWSANLGARLFAVDAQTNVYANSGGTVFVLNSSGIPLQTNLICPLPGQARRDNAGNYYFGGSFDGTQNFGGITLVGGWTNFNGTGKYAPGYPTCFLAKYSSNGTLQSVTSFGQQANQNILTDFVLDPAGGAYAGYLTLGGSVGGFDVLSIVHLNDSAGQDWVLHGSQYGVATKLGGVTASNCCALSIQLSSFAAMSRLDRNGNVTVMGQYPLLWHSPWCTNGQPVIDDVGNPLQVGQCFNPVTGICPAQWLRKCAPGADLYDAEINTNAEWILARDAAGKIYVAGTNGMLARFSNAGDLIWSNNFARPCVGMVADPAGNRFVSFPDGVVARLQDDLTPQPPAIAMDPRSQTVFSGDNAALTVSAIGTAPLSYQWRLNGLELSGATSTSLQFNPVTPANAGTYVVVVTNAIGSITSAPALLRVKSVELYAGSQMLTNGAYVFGTPPTLTIRSAFAGGSNYYTLDGSAPTRFSTPYTGPFQLEHNATVRAIGYSANGSQSEEADVVIATVYSQHTLTVTISGSGNVFLNPPGGTYANTNFVTATAVPSPGSSFLFWLGDASGGNPSVTLSMEYDRSIIAVFGTNLPAGQAPGLAWSTNLSARLFAVDGQTNVYANRGGTVFVLNSSGIPLQTNLICPLPGQARRDNAGNYYFGGSFDGTQNFGGITLVGGWTNFNGTGKYAPGYPTCFLAKYSSNGTLQWVNSFGQQAVQNVLTDFVLDPAGGVYAGYLILNYNGNALSVVHLNDSGGRDWVVNGAGSQYGTAIKLGGATASNCCALSIQLGPFAGMSRLDRHGNVTVMGQYPLIWRSPWCTNGEPVIDDLGNPLQVGECYDPFTGPCGAQWLRKMAPGTNLWAREILSDAEWILARDLEGAVYVAGTNGMLARFSNAGDLIWSNNFAQISVGMLADSTDNRFLSFADGTVARLGSDVSQQGFAISGGGQSPAQLSLMSQPQKAWQIQASSNLVSWWTFATITNSSGGLQFHDPTSRKAPLRFYRAVPLP